MAKKTKKVASEHCCGPEHDSDFFKAVAEVMKRYPDAAKRYAIKCIDHETDMMGIDFAKKSGVSKIEDGKVVMEFVDAKKAKVKGRVCCLWIVTPRGRVYCAAYWQ